MPSNRIAEYTVEKIIGEGRYGICYQVSYGQKTYIVKQLKRGMLKKAGAKARFEEEILKSLQHESVPRFIKKIEREDFCGYVLEFKEGRTFEDIIYLDKRVFEREEIYRVGSQLVGILKYLHSKGIVHRDIRVPNTLYDGQKVNLLDFGLARWFNNEKYRADMDFAFLGDFLLHLYYSSFDFKGYKKRPWYYELKLGQKELLFLKRLMGVEQRYKSILEVEHEFLETFEAFK
ncbi:protein kinase family protein [Desulfosporosinus sp.]|uniref:protein kinase domain-containing protein n=1 Tax=Desulfosporosinus sp. TaxID=157907 RepID=UPI00260EBFE8|nr:protein kinase family protein [Desulfosporosinus sp.]